MRFRLLGINTELGEFLSLRGQALWRGKVYSYHMITWYAI